MLENAIGNCSIQVPRSRQMVTFFFHNIDIEIPDMTIQNVGPQDITASASLADVYNAGFL
jgi:hypothetical protein